MAGDTVGVPRVNRYSWRTNLNASVNGRIVIPKAPENRIHRINWWNLDTLAESGDIIGSGKLALVEGPLPNGGVTIGLNANAFRDEPGLHILMISGHGGNNGTNANGLGRNPIPHFTFPRGIWSVEDVFILVATDGGVDHIVTSLGFEVVSLTRSQWLDFKRHSPNQSFQGELIQ